MIDPLVLRLTAFALGALLLGAAWHKARQGPRFEAILADYQVLPVAVIWVTARLIPALEALLGLAWLAGWALPLVASVTAGLFAVYGLGIAINLLRGRLHIDCGCGLGGPTRKGGTLSWLLVARNGLLIAVSLLAWIPPAQRQLGGVDWLTTVAGLVTAALLFGAISQLVTNRAAIRVWRRSGD